MTDILQAILNCDLQKLKVFLSDKRRVNLGIPGTEGCTPLHLIVGVENDIGREEALSYFLEIGADPNARSYDDLTPVHIAAMWNNCAELEKLIQNGGNPWLTDNENKNAFDLAIDNHAYDAYQLLNKYLSEDKLDFRVSLPKYNTPRQNRDINNTALRQNRDINNTALRQNCDINNETIKDNVYSRYFSAHENFPLYFSSTDDDESYLNVSKILKRELTKSRIDERNTYSTPRHPERKIAWNKDIELLSDICSSKCSFEEAEKKICPNETNSSDTEAEKKISPNETDSSDTEAYTLSENEYEIPEIESSETIIECDNKSGIVLVEKSFAVVDVTSFSFKSCNMSDCDNYTDSDWKSSHSQSISIKSEKSCSSHCASIFIPPDYRKLSNSAIFYQLKNLGDNPGPVSNSTREVYLRRLAQLKSGCNTSCNLPRPKYCSEVYMFLEGKFEADRIQNMMNVMSEEFDSADPDKKWREGNQRNCFNYFLLDPRVTQNLPLRLKQLSFEKAFLTFMDALFYVGKGMKSRPYSHLLEAAKVGKGTQWKSDKIAHILDIWESGHGVISLHCFNNCIPVEAYTQEACIIDAIGLENLTNIKNGNYYGAAAKWKWSWKRKVGVELLHRALQIFILEGEKQILPKDVRSTKL